MTMTNVTEFRPRLSPTPRPVDLPQAKRLTDFMCLQAMWADRRSELLQAEEAGDAYTVGVIKDWAEGLAQLFMDLRTEAGAIEDAIQEGR